MKEKILEICEGINETIDFTATDLIDANIMDSLTLIEVVTELMEAFEIEIPFEEMQPYNFNSIEAMESLIKKYM